MNDDSSNMLIDNQQLSIYDYYPYIFEDTTPAGTPMSYIERIISVFIAPGRLAENIREFPKLGAPALLLFIVSTLSAVMSTQIVPIITNAQSVALAERYGMDYINLTQAISNVMEQAAWVIYLSAWGGAIIGAFLAVLITALVLKIITLVLRGSATYKQYLSLAMHVYLISFIGGIVVILLMLVTNSPMTFTSLAPILMPNGNFLDIMYSVLEGIELFSIWAAVVIAIGVKQLNPGFSGNKAVITAAVYFILGLAFIAFSTSIVILTYDNQYMQYEAMQLFQ